jgi:hypothetical protein
MAQVFWKTEYIEKEARFIYNAMHDIYSGGD